MRTLEWLCGHPRHWRSCRLAMWSDRLDQRWGTGVWKLAHHPDDGVCVGCGRDGHPGPMPSRPNPNVPKRP